MTRSWIPNEYDNSSITHQIDTAQSNDTTQSVPDALATDKIPDITHPDARRASIQRQEDSPDKVDDVEEDENENENDAGNESDDEDSERSSQELILEVEIDQTADQDNDILETVIRSPYV